MLPRLRRRGALPPTLARPGWLRRRFGGWSPGILRRRLRWAGPFQGQKPVRQEGQRRMMMEAAPAAPSK